MNETILTNRQKSALSIISQSEGVSRENVQKILEKVEPVSRPTLIRDLNVLLDKKLIRVEGKASSTRYFSIEDNPLLRYFDLETYFKLDPDQRVGTKKLFDFGVLKHLKNIFSEIELKEIKNISRSFSAKVSDLSFDIYKKELERFVIELSWKSSKIEGNTYSLLETEELIKKGILAEGHPKDEVIMILNHKKAFEEILKNKEDFKKLSVSKINQLHSIIVQNLNINTGIRNEAVGITGTVYIPLDNKFQIEDAIKEMLNLINDDKNPPEKAFIASVMIPYIQPYSDGNKRTSRMLVNAILLAGDNYPLSYRSVDVDEYKKALILFYEQGSLFHVKRIFLEQVNFAYKNYFQ
ncbi:MAG: Fic family protein [Candidatus Woesebacteria bacterium GW2011_GWA1_37_7]|uniref:Fic family protein n=1 Tax=Candidatus Woesebacteria bacterium GW2011_GWA1_37_7 TaxID=1618545 RepID=A0A0G0H317_9BACT|nr:MAG: Fic family protein [Candidatus Woesebacteria bacterium GW2011_GWA1_37_7]